MPDELYLLSGVDREKNNFYTYSTTDMAKHRHMPLYSKKCFMQSISLCGLDNENKHFYVVPLEYIASKLYFFASLTLNITHKKYYDDKSQAD